MTRGIHPVSDPVSFRPEEKEEIDETEGSLSSCKERNKADKLTTFSHHAYSEQGEEEI